ncbi:hypothetical protein TPHA_0O01240 [Tetrapisispora phaffii CBS 4417]|uniref:N-acetyltransferase ECO1 n=1 Tax=Tetrapisispora phaffii (strain ATCC 24235 / CBS 4417 / NBRC 1672 / NRRL Y-8282 / UCD 70-5) TaxID=1071381 RepID=G8C1R5_TETPH|nr:hypothetical protein TPHA_0O01240 [Tetrapisispora phaffii CBS 4417]CCE66093.1 hypothetical protein TPHA_0O01240 [Tetrapisispora phaffii CBS 4417]
MKNLGSSSKSKINPKSVVKNNNKYVQSRLQFNSNKTSRKSNLTKCEKCGMLYSINSIPDIDSHKTYHTMHLSGHKWAKTWGSYIEGPKLIDQKITPPTSSSTSNDSTYTSDLQSKNEYVVVVRPQFPKEVKAASELMSVVNDELNAPHNENDFWATVDGKGKLFLYIKDDRAVGAISVEPIDSTRSRWMVYENKSIIDHIRPHFKVGISRIWVCKEHRSQGIAVKLLEAARTNMNPSRTMQRWELAWSQPTESGGKLASKYNGMKHKSGKLLIPCYI